MWYLLVAEKYCMIKEYNPVNKEELPNAGTDRK